MTDGLWDRLPGVRTRRKLDQLLGEGLIMAANVQQVPDVVDRDTYEPTAEPIALTRRRWLGVAGMTAALGGAGVLTSAPAHAGGHRDGARNHCNPQAPRPIPGTDPFLASLGIMEHVFLPAPFQEPSTIFDFHGRVAIMDLVGDGIRTVNDVDEPAAFRADLRFMEGTYIGLDGKTHQNTFHFL